MIPDRAVRGIRLVAADASVADMLAQINRAFEQFKAENDSRIKTIEAGRSADVVQLEKIDRMNASIGEMQTLIDQTNQKIAAIAANAGDGGRKIRDPEYSKAFAQFMAKGVEVNATMSKGSAPDGGYFAPVEWDRSITDKLVIVSPMRRLCTVQKISVGGFSKLYNSRGTGSGWVGETAARPETASPQAASLAWAFGEIYANPMATQTLLDDAEVDLEAWLAGQVETEFAYQEGVAFVSGNGTNKPNGLLTYVTGGTNAGTHPFGAIAAIASGAVGALTTDGLTNLVYALPSAFTGNASFGMNRSTQGAVRLLKDTTNNYIWQPSLVAGQPAALLGYPCEEIAALPNVATGAKSVLFGDFKQAYLIIDRIGVRVLRDPFTNKPYIGFYTTKRVGGGVNNPEAMKAINVG